MKRPLLSIIIILFAFAESWASSPLPYDNDDLLNLLDHEIARRKEFVSKRHHKIDSVSSLILRDSLGSIDNYLLLGDLYSGLNADTAIMVYSHACDIALRTGNPAKAQRLMIKRLTELRKINSTPNAINDLKYIAKGGIYPENSALFNEVSRDFYYTIAELFEGTGLHKAYIGPGLDFAYKLRKELPEDSNAAKLNDAMISYAQRNDAMFLAHLTEVAERVQPGDPHYSIILTALGGRQQILGQTESAIRNLSLAALNDVREADLHATALFRLGTALYEAGDIARAHGYLSIALDEALASGSKTNCMMIAEAFRPVANELRKREKSQMIRLSILTGALAIGLVFVIILYRSNRKRTVELERARVQLATANYTKESFISEFMNLSSSYMESLEDFIRLCRRKLTAGQADDLLNLINSGKVIEEQRKKFYDIFDDAFLAIYPTFIDDVNALLLPDKRISISAKNVLTAELRVLAFARLGLEDTTRIARFLGLTNNTIYTYRNKLRSKAISRETFDTDIMKIGHIS